MGNATKNPRRPKQDAGNEPILVINNRHIAACGQSPQIELKGGNHYTAYFENAYGEQCLMQYDCQKREAQLWMGDVGWEEPLKVIEFRGKPVVLFVRPEAERRADSRMNKQFDGLESRTKEDATATMIRDAVHTVVRKVHGSPRLTDEECDRLSDGPILNQGERRTIEALWTMWAG